jgi:hypothetical protein
VSLLPRQRKEEKQHRQHRNPAKTLPWQKQAAQT